MNLNPFSAIFDEKTHVQHFGLYAANMLQNAAALIFWGVYENDCLFLSWIIWNNNFQSILNNFQWKNQYAAFFTCMQQVCCSMQQPRLCSNEHPFWVYLAYKTGPVPKFWCLVPQNNLPVHIGHTQPGLIHCFPSGSSMK